MVDTMSYTVVEAEAVAGRGSCRVNVTVMRLQGVVAVWSL